MNINDMVSEINRSARCRYMSGDAVEIMLTGHHPNFEIEEVSDDKLVFREYEADSINLVGRYPVRNVVTLGDTSSDEPDVVVVYDGKYDYYNMIFGSFVSPKTLTAISGDLELPYSFS